MTSSDLPSLYTSRYAALCGCLLRSIHLTWLQTGSGAHTASYTMGTRGSFLSSKVAGAWSWPLTSI